MFALAPTLCRGPGPGLFSQLLSRSVVSASAAATTASSVSSADGSALTPMLSGPQREYSSLICPLPAPSACAAHTSLFRSRLLPSSAAASMAATTVYSAALGSVIYAPFATAASAAKTAKTAKAAPKAAAKPAAKAATTTTTKATKAPAKPAAAAKTATAAPKTAAAAAVSLAPGSLSAAEDAAASSQYQKLSQREHILARPDPYLGAFDPVTETHWVLAEPSDAPLGPGAGAAAAAASAGAVVTPGGVSSLKKLKSAKDLAGCRIVESVVTFVPALFKIFDEILVNACDNVHRPVPAGAPKMSSVAVTINPADGTVTVSNDGAAIPIVVHESEGLWVPELIFGHLLTSSNYDDTVARFTGGRNGFGAKLTNIFSTRFSLEIVDAQRGKVYTQVFDRNLSVIHPPVITAAPAGTKASSTKISFTPDLARFFRVNNAKGGANKTLPLPDDTLRLMRRRVFDAAACLGPSGVKVTLDGHRVPINSFSDYLAITPAFCGISGVGVSSEADAADASAEAAEAAEAAEFDDSVEAAIAAAALEAEASAQKGKLTIAEVNDHWLIAVGPRYQDMFSPSGAALSAQQQQAQAQAQAQQMQGAMRQISFVNGISTARGGTHVSFISDQVARYLAAYMTEGRRRRRFGLDPDSDVPLGLVRAHMTLLVSCLIPNPSFDSQTKDVLLTPLQSPARRVGFAPSTPAAAAAAAASAVSAPELPTKLLERIARTSGVCEAVADVLCARQAREERRKLVSALGKGARTGRRQHLNIEKLDDANLAGTPRSHECTLILTEGDSAKALALSGLAVVGREKFGVFPLRGKLLNVRDATVAAVQKNKELTEVAEILGLKIGEDYSTEAARRGLRYGRVMLMADQDHDGSHIKGLFLNMIDCFWPSLLQSNAFMQEFITPIVKATPTSSKDKDVAVLSRSTASSSNNAPSQNGATAGSKKDNTALSFYSLPDYYKWKNALTEDQLRRFRIKYYKGLGTSTAAEGRDYFSRLASHVISFAHQGESSVKALDLAFNKAKADERKSWLLAEGLDAEGGELVPTVTAGRMGITEFVNRELVHFSRADTVRSIPSLVDGLKPGQRKILYACFKRNLTQEIKVAQLAGYVAEHTGYHHGEQSLNSTIVNMAQDFVFSNNLPLLAPIGQFGTRHMGGKDAASPRYIFTKLQPFTRKIFRPEDDAVLDYCDDDGDPVEPRHYVPILPLVLCNGTEGIGTGFSTSVPTYHPLQLISNLRLLLAKRPVVPMLPWAWGFTGTVSPDPANAHRFITEGSFNIVKNGVDGMTVDITELPWGVWNAQYKAFLCTLLDPKVVGAAAASDAATNTSGFTIAGFSEHHTENTVRFRVSLSPDQAEYVDAVGVAAAFRLTTSFLTSNMHLFDSQGKISLFDSPEAVMSAFVPVRLALYAKRRAHQLAVLRSQADKAGDRMKFIQLVISGELVLSKRKKTEIIKDLVKFGLRPISANAANNNNSNSSNNSTSFANVKPTSAANSNSAASGAAVDGDDSSVIATTAAGVAVRGGDFDYLLNMPMSSLSEERLAALAREIATIAAAVADLEGSTPQSLWLRELDELEAALADGLKMPSVEGYLAAQATKEVPVLTKGIKGRKTATAAAGKGKGAAAAGKGKGAAAASKRK